MLRAAREVLAHDDPWTGFAHFFTTAVLAGTGSLGPVAGTIEVNAAMLALGSLKLLCQGDGEVSE